MRRRVLLLVAAATTLVLVAFLVPLALLVENVAADRAVQRATVEAQELTSLVVTTERSSLAASVREVDANSPYDVSVFVDGDVLGARASRSSLVTLAEHGISQSGEVSGGREIVFSVDRPGASPAVIRTFVSDTELASGVPRAWLLLGGLGVALLLVSLLVADRLARTFVRSTVDLAAVSHRLGRGELEARANTTAPAELGVVATALNGLAGRIAEALREERETIADLSHRVRTPLTSLRMEADALADPAAAARVGAGVDAVNRAVSEVIAQARRRGAAPESADAAGVVADRVAFWAVLAEDTERELTVAVAPGPLPVGLARADLEACVDALLGNIFAHTPNGTAFRVALSPRDGGAVLTVEDAGPGLPDGGVVRRGVSGAGSTGLGLDIVRRAGERTGGSVRLERSPLGGLRVVVDLLGPR
ncbi:sensor histidine kinase [Actinophytocola oryzae]|uniref:Signal transduction histidine-protein kinase/phosphatase MprB n=1 Tax=Actinophytocola oryzae TaxID=502181 RepID=A0A4R7W139_9PSEU|nr:HAMP domain-containing sensor histidine kinase [Actinophytocola oryzae]TDV55237.1 signal transduction histidine kinase [Actinophytocola oryzae]